MKILHSYLTTLKPIMIGCKHHVLIILLWIVGTLYVLTHSLWKHRAGAATQNCIWLTADHQQVDVIALLLPFTSLTIGPLVHLYEKWKTKHADSSSVKLWICGMRGLICSCLHVKGVCSLKVKIYLLLQHVVEVLKMYSCCLRPSNGQ